MKFMIKKAACLALAGALVASSLSVNTVSQAAPKAKKIIMNKKSVELEVGQTFKLKVKKIKPAKASKAVTYKIAKKKQAIATVSKKGKITAKSVGTVKVTVTSKKNKKAKTKVTVKVVAAQTAPTVAPSASVVASATPGALVTKAPETPATSTPKPTRTPRVTATPSPVPTATPKPTAPPMPDPSKPYSLAFNDDTVAGQGDGSYVINADGSVTISVTAQYGGVGFTVPESLTEDNFNTVTVTYKDATNVGTGYGCGLWRDGKETEDVVAWSGVFADEAAGTVTFTLPDSDSTNAYYINKILFFCNDSDAMANGAAKVTITNIEFSHSDYAGGNGGNGGNGGGDDIVVPEGAYSLPLTADNVVIFGADYQNHASYTVVDDGIDVTITGIYDGPVFKLPASEADKGYDTVTVTYKDSSDGAFKSALWNGSTELQAWESTLPSSETSATFTLSDTSTLPDRFVIYSGATPETPWTITITSVVFSKSN